jgi:glycerol-3-phosphate dehydrogenase (NAD(P)+)
MNVAVLGGGAWGTAVAINLAHRHRVTLWARSPEQCALMSAQRENARYLPGFGFPENLGVSSNLAEAIRTSELILVAVPTAALRETIARVALAGVPAPLVALCKGFEPASAKLAHEVCCEELGAGSRCGVLSGPSFAQEVARSQPTAVTLASASAEFARGAALALHSPSFRVYSSDDVVGVEVAGAVKNVIAIAAGISDGLDYGHNARAALITRGLAEVTRLGVALGGRAETFMGLAGAGDLILTCTGDLSRNRKVGLELGRGESLSAILQRLGHVAEGVYTAREVERRALALNVDMPITQSVCDVLFRGMSARTAVEQLLARDPKAEN